MTYVDICKPCLEDNHPNCLVSWGVKDTDPEVCGGGHCICTHKKDAKDRSNFEQSIWDNQLLTKKTNLLREVCNSGVELDDPRMDYVVVQIDRVTWNEINEN